jgi:hypothetical protein
VNARTAWSNQSVSDTFTVRVPYIHALIERLRIKGLSPVQELRYQTLEGSFIELKLWSQQDSTTHAYTAYISRKNKNIF